MRFVIFFVFVCFYSFAFANQDEFCMGFEEGYKTIRGDMVLVPICPIAPIAPMNSTYYREGLKAGIKKGKEDEN
jgi:hypothetical protein